MDTLPAAAPTSSASPASSFPLPLPSTPSQAPPPKKKAGVLLPTLVFLLLLALVTIPTVLTFQAGYARGGATVWSESNIGLIGVFLIPLQLVFILLALGLGRRRNFWTLAGNSFIFILPVLLLEPIKLGLVYDGAYCFAGNENRGKLVWARGELQWIQETLEEYRLKGQGYPATLKDLFSPAPGDDSANARPHKTVYGGYPQPRYATCTLPGAPHPGFWILWQPGPSGQWAIAPGPQLQGELANLSQGLPPGAWLLDRIYDPTNGAAHGDIVLWKQ
jgi:hypothetical protein